MTPDILVVDDDHCLNGFVRTVLTHCGYRARAAFDGIEAERAIAVARPDLIVLDVRMPRRNGWEVLAELRRCEATRELPVLLLTVLDDEADWRRAWQSGIDGYLAKPFEPVELIATIARLLKPPQLVSN